MGNKKWKHLQDLAGHCRLLSILTLLFFGITSLILVIVCAATLGSESTKYDPSKLFSGDYDDPEEKKHAVILITLTVLSIVATLVSVLLLLATFTDNMWLTIPYWLLLIVLICLCLYQLLHFGLCIGRCEGPLSSQSAFARNIMHGGGVYIFSSMAFLGFLTYVFLSSFGFFLECRAKRAENLAARKKSVPIPPPLPPPPPLAPHPILHPPIPSPDIAG